MEVHEIIKEQIASNQILIYMKGSPNSPQCGFSSQASQALMSCGEPFSYIDILANPEIRAKLPEISDWPTFPQVFIKGELIGGADIVAQMHASGDLLKAIQEATS